MLAYSRTSHSSALLFCSMHGIYLPVLRAGFVVLPEVVSTRHLLGAIRFFLESIIYRLRNALNGNRPSWSLDPGPAQPSRGNPSWLGLNEAGLEFPAAGQSPAQSQHLPSRLRAPVGGKWRRMAAAAAVRELETAHSGSFPVPFRSSIPQASGPGTREQPKPGRELDELARGPGPVGPAPCP
jgi:hypothetical protein